MLRVRDASRNGAGIENVTVTSSGYSDMFNCSSLHVSAAFPSNPILKRTGWLDGFLSNTSEQKQDSYGFRRCMKRWRQAISAP